MDRKEVAQITRGHSLKSFIDENQYLEFHLETQWKPVQLMEQSCKMGDLSTPLTAYTTAFWTSTGFKIVFKSSSTLGTLQ